MKPAPPNAQLLQRLRWIAPGAILALAAVLRLWALGRPDSLVFDELYYVRDAVTQLVHGYPTGWPDDDPAFGGERARAFLDQASTIAHPPLGKWLIGLGILALGPDSGWGWRLAVALAGVATVAVTMRIGYLVGRSIWVACFAGLLLALDGVHIVLSRVSLLDGFLTLFVALGALFVVRDWLASGARWGTRAEPGILWCRPWLLAAGLAFGAAAAVKWSGLYPLTAFLVLLTMGDLLRRLGSARLVRHADRPAPARRPGWRALGDGVLQALVTAAIALPAAFAAYLASWIGWIVTPAGSGRVEGEAWWVSLWRWHADSLAWHSTLSAPHPYQSNPWSWPLGLHPTAMYSARSGDYISTISPIPNPIVTWLGVGALLLLVWVVVRSAALAARTRRLAPLRGRAVTVSAFVLTGYLSGWVPWLMLSSRPAVFQFYAVVLTPFAATALALVLASFASLPRSEFVLQGAGVRLSGSFEARQGRGISVALVLATALLLTLLFWPLWIGMPIKDWFYGLHRWLPGW